MNSTIGQPDAIESYLGNRYEFKYLLSPELAHRIEAYVAGLGLTLDRNSKNGAYTVHSLYFETPFMDDYQDKEASLLVRKKMRARMYEPAWHHNHESVWLEIKNKRNFHVSKERIKLPGAVWNQFIDSGSTFALLDSPDERPADRQIKKRFSYLYERSAYEPYVTIRYNRTAYLDDYLSTVRITFDTNIEVNGAAERYDADAAFIPVTTNEVVMEVKFNDQLPWWFKTVVSVFDLQRTDFSKYNHSVAKLRDLYRISVNK